MLFALPVDEAASFLDDLSYEPWLAVELPLPGELDAEALRAVRAIVYAVIQAVDFTLDEFDGANRPAGRDRPPPCRRRA